MAYILYGIAETLGRSAADSFTVEVGKGEIEDAVSLGTLGIGLLDGVDRVVKLGYVTRDDDVRAFLP